MATLVLLIIYILRIYYYLIFAYVLLSWIPSIRRSRFYYYIARIVEPYMGIFRRIIPPIGGLDFSPILAIFLLVFASQGFANLYLKLII